MEDFEIVELYWSRNPEAIRETSHKYGAYCFSIANNILDDSGDAEECVNDTWMRAWNAMPPQRPARLRLFLAKITRGIAFNKASAKNADRRGGGQLPLILDELAECIESGTRVETEVDARELGRCINKFVRSLPQREGDIFIRRCFFTESAAVIGRRFGLTENNVSVILSRTRRKLRAYLKKEGWFK